MAGDLLRMSIVLYRRHHHHHPHHVFKLGNLAHTYTHTHMCTEYAIGNNTNNKEETKKKLK